MKRRKNMKYTKINKIPLSQAPPIYPTQHWNNTFIYIHTRMYIFMFLINGRQGSYQRYDSFPPLYRNIVWRLLWYAVENCKNYIKLLKNGDVQPTWNIVYNGIKNKYNLNKYYLITIYTKFLNASKGCEFFAS